MNLQEMIESRAALVAAAEGILEKAKTEERELTDEERATVDGNIDEAEKLQDDIARQQKIESVRSWSGASVGRVSDVGPADNTGDTENRSEPFKVPANVKRWGKLRSWTGPDADAKAYRFGQWCLAVNGNQNAQRFCKNHGLELRTHTENVNSAGGFLVPEEFDNDLIDLRVQYGVFRQHARISPMMSDTKSRRRRQGGLTAYFVGEAEQGTVSDKSWDQVSLTAKKLMVLSSYSNELNEDAVLSIGDDLAGEIAYAFAAKEDDCGFNGDGTSTYGGIVGIRNAFLNLSATRANIAGLVVGAGTTFASLTLANFNSVVARLPSFGDTPRARWFVHKTFWGDVMQRLAYAAGGNDTANIAAGTVGTFLGYPVVATEAMPKVTGVDQVSAILGDLFLAADYGDRRQTTIAFSDSATVNSVSVFEYDEIAIRGTERFDINVHDVGNQSGTAASRQAGPIVALATAAS